MGCLCIYKVTKTKTNTKVKGMSLTMQEFTLYPSEKMMNTDKREGEGVKWGVSV